MGVLRLLDEVTFDGRPVTGDRNQALLAALAGAHGRTVVESDLVETVWGAEVPANPAKALQVVVSRTRGQTAAEAVARVDGGYRLGPVQVDVDLLGRSVREAQRAEAAGDASTARDHARTALDVVVAQSADVEPLAELRAAASRVRAAAAGVLGRSLAALGEHEEALVHLESVPDPDEATLAALLRSQAAVHGAPTALRRYERHREDVRDALGVDPGPVLQAVHAELLAADNPVRSGVHFEATPLVGRDDDVRRLRALVRDSRVTSIVGPGGLGKTTLAHLLGRTAEQPVVRFVELVGVVSPDDVVGEVGSVLGVRDSVSGRRVLTPEQRADVRARIAAQLDQAPTLLVLDNCEHVVEAVADLVAFLVATTRTLRVVTTTRAPLAIAAERVFDLGTLDDDAAVELFRQRALAARPDARLDDEAVRRVVARLDGLPLAIELAAAKVRAMSVADVGRRLDDRFALLRGTDRGRPDRHQTLLAVIDWSWALLGEADRRALRRLSVFADGFALHGAEAVVGPEALAAVESLVGQSLLTVRDAGAEGVRYRMLETVREFGRLRLIDAGDDNEARAALRGWALEVCHTAAARMTGPDQVAAVREVAAEEANLAEVLREALGEGDVPAVVVLLGALGSSWTIRGDHLRVITLTDAVEEVLEGWDPPADLVDPTAAAVSMLVMNSVVTDAGPPPRSLAVLAAVGPRSSRPEVRALAQVLGTEGSFAAADRFVDSEDRHVAMVALQWTSHARENLGDLDGAMVASRRALDLWRPEDGPWARAQHHTQLAGLHAQQGRTDLAEQHAAEGLGVLEALEAYDDAVQLRAVLAYAAIARGDLARAQQVSDEIAAEPQQGLWGGGFVVASTRAELALALGDVATGLAHYDEAVAAAERVAFPGVSQQPGLQPWTLYAESSALAAYARHGLGPDGRDLRARLGVKAPALARGDGRRTDYPVIGCVLFALGAWSLLRDGEVEPALERLALAERFGYSRYTPSTAWEPMVAAADAVAPGALAARVASYGDRRGPDLLDEARAALAGA